MKNAIVFSSTTGNTERLANAIKEKLSDVAYFGKPSDEALEADVLYVGSWAIGYSCTEDIKEFLSKLNGKKVFLFVTAGYGSTDEFYAPIMEAVKSNLNDSNEIIGEFICQGKVSAPKRTAMEQGNPEKYAGMKPELDKAESHPDAQDLTNLQNKLA